MLFVSDSIARKRRKLAQQVRRGTLTAEQAFLRGLELDAFDSIALVAAGIGCEQRGDGEQARRYFWRALEAEPAVSNSYVLLSVSYRASDPELADSLMDLALMRALASPEELEPISEQWLADVRAAMAQKLPGFDEDALREYASTHALERRGEPERVTQQLLPYRLIQEVIDRPDGGMDREIVDRILEQGAACVPLLIGVLRGWTRHPENDDVFPAEAALALLGEIGDEAALPAIRECMAVPDPLISRASVWAEQRITKRSDSGRTVYDFCCMPLEVVDDEDEPVAQVRKEARPERNDPCWCGSGKKYKKCHLDSDEINAHEQSQDRRISDMLLQFMKENIKTAEMEQAFKMFFGPNPPAELAPTDQMGFFDWFLNDYVSGRFRRTITQEYLARNQERLTARDRKSLQEWTDSYCSLFEVQRVDKGVGVELKDLLLGGVLFVNDITSSNNMARWDSIFSRIRKEGSRTIFTAVGMGVTPPVRDALRDWIVADKEASGLDWRPFLRGNSHHIRREILEMYDEYRQNMRFVNAEGDEVVFGKAVYRILNRDRVLEALEGAELIGARDDEDGVVRFTWFETAEKKTDEGRRVLGSLRLEGDRLILECSSRQRLKRGMAMLQKLAGAALQEKLTEFQSPQSMMKNKPEDMAKPAPQSSIPPELERQVVTEMKERHFRSWLDKALPALNGRTPRQAAQDAEGRARLIELLKQAENSEEHERLKGRAWYDVSRLKAELGVDY